MREQPHRSQAQTATRIPAIRTRSVLLVAVDVLDPHVGHKLAHVDTLVTDTPGVGCADLRPFQISLFPAQGRPRGFEIALLGLLEELEQDEF